jgi:hypothetical protein
MVLSQIKRLLGNFGSVGKGINLRIRQFFSKININANIIIKSVLKTLYKYINR